MARPGGPKPTLEAFVDFADAVSKEPATAFPIARQSYELYGERCAIFDKISKIDNKIDDFIYKRLAKQQNVCRLCKMIF